MAGPFQSPSSREFEQILRDGISAAKSGQRRLAQSLLRQAILLNGADARPYLWLSSTTDDAEEQRQYLEQAVVIDPNNTAARRGLAVLTGKLDRSSLLEEGAMVKPTPPEEVAEARAQVFICPKCGGRMAFSVQHGQLTCEYCGYVQAGERKADPGSVESKLRQERLADEAEKVLDFVVPTPGGHRWANVQQQLSCERCGAVTLLPPGQKTSQCPYCGSNRMVISLGTSEILDPQVIALMEIDALQASRRVKDWLGRGLFTPDDLLRAVRRLDLRPAYYSCWTFDGTLEVRWSCEVKEGSGRYARWVPRNGVEMRFFDDVLVPGVKALSAGELESIEPFRLKEVKEFQPEYLAGWPALIYDRSLSDASLIAREKVTRQVRNELYHSVEAGREKRNLNTGGGNWSGMTFKHILLPLWIGTYHYQNQEFHLLVNGQTGKVGGNKPRDPVKIALAVLIVAALIILLGLMVWIWFRSGLAV